MSEMIPAELLDAACREIAGYSNDESQATVRRLSTAQPALFSYFMQMTEDSSEAEQAFAGHLFQAIYKVFDQQFGGRLRNVGRKQVEQIADHNEQAMIYLRIRHPEEQILSDAMPWSVPQLYLLVYVHQLIFVPHEGLPQLSEISQDGLLIVMKTVIDVLDSAISAKG